MLKTWKMELITPGILTKRKYPETYENQTENRHSAGRKKNTKDQWQRKINKLLIYLSI